MTSRCRKCGETYWKGTTCNCRYETKPFQTTHRRITGSKVTGVKQHGFHEMTITSEDQRTSKWVRSKSVSFE